MRHIQARALPNAPAPEVAAAPPPGRPMQAPVQVAQTNPAVEALSALLRLEAEARAVQRVPELLQLAANETRLLVQARQVVVARPRRDGRLIAAAVSGLAVVDRTSPTVQWFEDVVRRLGASAGLDGPRAFTLPDHADTADETTRIYPFRHVLWVPFWSREPRGSGGLLLTRETPWPDGEQRIAARLALTYGHALALLEAPRGRLRSLPLDRRAGALAALLVLAAGALPVTMTALAPVEIVAREPSAIAMAVDGQVAEVPPDPGTRVAAGATLVRLVDTHLRNKLEITERELAVAEAGLDKTTQLALVDRRGRHELAIARADVDLKRAERDYAREMLAKATLTAPRAGLVLYGDRKDLVGRPFALGDRLMEIADPARVELRIDLPVADALVLEPGARVRVFLDTDPLHALEARVVRFDYQARVEENRIAVFRVIAELTGDGAPPRLGIRGTAEVAGGPTRLAWFLLRRPLTALRQWTGL